MKEIPWEYLNTPLSKLWRWLTKDFDAHVKSDGNFFVITVSDLTRGRRVPVYNEMATDFTQASNQVLEFVGKSYPASLGYKKWAGELATTFAISTHERINFAPLEGQHVELYTIGQLGEDKFEGSLAVVNHRIELRQDNGKVVSIPPALIVSIDGNAANKYRASLAPTINVPRIVPGKPSPGCTGVAGFLPGTVDHPRSSTWCPVHKV